MALKRTSIAVWNGDGKTGSGKLSTQSGAFTDQPYSSKARFEDASGKSATNPEELIGAAHAGCFSMALAFALKEAGFTPTELRAEAAVSMEQVTGGYALKEIVLNLKATIPGIDNGKFQEIAKKAKENCPISKALAAVKIELKAQLT